MPSLEETLEQGRDDFFKNAEDAAMKPALIEIRQRQLMQNMEAYKRLVTATLDEYFVTEAYLKTWEELPPEQKKFSKGQVAGHIINGQLAALAFLTGGNRDRNGAIAIGVVAFVMYFLTNLLVLYGSPNNRLFQIRVEHFRKNCNNMKTHVLNIAQNKKAPLRGFFIFYIPFRSSIAWSTVLRVGP